MKMMDLYNNIKNPLDDSKTMERLLEIYSSDQNFYDGLIKTDIPSDSRAFYTKADRDKFYSDMFNKWKRSIVNMTEGYYKQLLASGVVESDFLKLRSFLKTYPDIKTAAEMNNAGSEVGGEIVDIIDKYMWGELLSSWCHVSSEKINIGQPTESLGKISHRLYICVPTDIQDKIASELVTLYESANMPYYFKFMPYEVRNDQIVIYSSTENLVKNIDILNKLDAKLEVSKKFGTPPLLSGKINNWIGYGSEPQKVNGKKTSFNEKREKIIEQSFESVTKNWIKFNANKSVVMNGKNAQVVECIVNMMVDNLITEQTRRYLFRKENHQKKAERENTKFNELDVVKEVGYSLANINAPVYRENVFKLIYNSIVSNITNGNFECSIKIPLLYEKSKELRTSDLMNAVSKFAKFIPSIDSEYLFAVRNRIINDSKAVGIDSNNYCFDVDKRDEMLKYDELQKSAANIKIYISNGAMFINSDVAQTYSLDTLKPYEGIDGLPLKEFNKLDPKKCNFVNCNFELPELILLKINGKYYIDSLAAYSVNLRTQNQESQGRILLTSEELDLLKSFYKIKVLTYNFASNSINKQAAALNVKIGM